MRHRSLPLLTTLIALSTLFGALVTLTGTPEPARAAAPPGLHHITDWRTYEGILRTPADPIHIAIYGPNSFDVQLLRG